MFLAAIFALSAAIAWGSGDFIAGLAARRVGPFRTVLISYSVGLLALLIVALVRNEPIPHTTDILWGALAGLSGMIGLGFLLRGFASGQISIVAPVSAVLAAAIPVIFAAFKEGLPHELQLLGFGLALVSIWLFSRPGPLGYRPAGLGMALLAGLGFSGFFIILSLVGENAIFWPLISGRLVACVLMTAFGLTTRRLVFPPHFPLGLLALIGVIDVSGNLFFLLAVQMGRLDVSAVLVSLYPAVTVILARLVNREKLARLQVIGVILAVLAIVLITI